MTTEKTITFTSEDDELWETVKRIHNVNGTPNHREEGPSAISCAMEGLDILGPVSLTKQSDKR